ncbi:Uncharacterised protein [Segatella copri]|nr:Uncharacterised protein [Segatella copri]
MSCILGESLLYGNCCPCIVIGSLTHFLQGHLLASKHPYLFLLSTHFHGTGVERGCQRPVLLAAVAQHPSWNFAVSVEWHTLFGEIVLDGGEKLLGITLVFRQ